MLRLFNNSYDLVFNEHARQTVGFYSTDDKDIYDQNIKKMGNEWKYYNSNIEYKFNSVGYRTKELSELSDKFLLTFGCSYTEGVGLHQNEIWTDQISKFLNLDLYNHAKQSAGMDIQYYNAMLWAMSKKPKPELVIVQWPDKARRSFAYRKADNISLQDRSYTKSVDGKWWGRRYIQDTGEMELNVLFWFESFNNLWKLEGVPVLNFTWDHDLEQDLVRSRYQIHRIKPKMNDKARDCQHDGPRFHKSTAEKIESLLSLSNFTDKV